MGCRWCDEPELFDTGLCGRHLDEIADREGDLSAEIFDNEERALEVAAEIARLEQEAAELAARKAEIVERLRRSERANPIIRPSEG